uniref:Uncharacterized protein n=1 Tax=Branchiostoma floridae TaxID=7739 RepID=C3Z160_BRAFL|eukprot:XP_002597747.1 hypothetical protein BRAFLDRAFT_77351 [Branchiostoma floridae]
MGDIDKSGEENEDSITGETVKPGQLHRGNGEVRRGEEGQHHRGHGDVRRGEEQRHWGQRHSFIHKDAFHLHIRCEVDVQTPDQIARVPDGMKRYYEFWNKTADERSMAGYAGSELKKKIDKKWKLHQKTLLLPLPPKLPPKPP